MIFNAKKHVDSVRSYISAIPTDFPGFKKASTINFLMGVETLSKMKDNPDIFYSDSPVKIDKPKAKDIISNPTQMFEKMEIRN